MNLKSLAENVISRNQQCNTGATDGEFTRNNATNNSATALRTADAATGLTRAEEREITDWLKRIGEPDPVVIGETLAKCRANPAALRFFLGLARGDDGGMVH